MALESGTWSPVTHRTVTVWPAPDANGDGEIVYDDEGNEQKDSQGNTVKTYEPPEGFRNIPSSDGSDNYVRVDERRRPIRNAQGLAVTISPGQTLIEYPDGSHTYLNSDRERRIFEESHEKIADVKKDAKPKAKVGVTP